MGLPGGSAGKESACRAGDLGPIPGSGRAPGGGNGSPLQCSDLENSRDCTVHGVAKSLTGPSDSKLTAQFSDMKQELANKAITMSSNFVGGFISTYFLKVLKNFSKQYIAQNVKISFTRRWD